MLKDVAFARPVAWPGCMHRHFMMNWWLFPPRTREVQFDEKGAFVGKKEKHCAPDDPADLKRGETWDHVAFDPEHRLVVSVVPGKRTEKNLKALVKDFHQRTDGRPMRLITIDGYPAYKSAILEAYGQPVVHKTRKNGRVVNVECRIVFGTEEAVAQALARSPVSRSVNTAFLERYHGTDRHRNARKARKTLCFSKDWEVHNAVTYFTTCSYNFCWPVRTLRTQDPAGRWHARTPAMAADLTDHVWSLREWITCSTTQCK